MNKTDIITITKNIYILPEMKLYVNTGVYYKILKEDDTQFLVNRGHEYLIINKESGFINSKFRFEIGEDIIMHENYLYINHNGSPKEYEYWFNPPNIVYKGVPPFDFSNDTLRFKEFKNKVEIYSFNYALANPREVKFTLNLNNK